ncbi:hypothetical protein BC936DRAFT_138469 [Jimgerdemannia flammicorona]|uniref:SAM domain-containing protein n=1 Tax=Jimgerdemannia flammicorona TaxID=994334 RepID=A0A433CCZ1_9FUNG|nr:hypothetical protein BC936DRAFT_138469 [Jimgerdemannia flammicorona]
MEITTAPFIDRAFIYIESVVAQRFFITTSRDMTARIFSLHPTEGFVPTTLSGHRDALKGAWFSLDQETIYTVSKDGALFVWKNAIRATLQNAGTGDSDNEIMDIDGDSIKPADPKRWRCVKRHYFNQAGAKVQSCAYHPESHLLVVGFSSGIFGIWEMPEFTNIHTLSSRDPHLAGGCFLIIHFRQIRHFFSISQKRIDSVSINPTGEWLAFGSSALGQLLVWEWQSESYVLKQQGHFYDMNTLSYSADGQSIVTGGDDGKVKVWNTTSGFCFVTFSEHTSGVAAVEFAKQGRVVFSASLDGTVRAFDLNRYRNFRTFTSPIPTQFTSLAVDPSGEIVCAGSMDTFEIFVWSVQTGKLLDVLAGHEGPVSCLAFSSTGLQLASGSWDKTVRIWDVFGRKKAVETFTHGTDVLAIAYRPDGREIACSTLDGQIAFWDLADGKQTGLVEGRTDISGGRKSTDRMTAENSASGKSFNSLCYTADGSCVLGGGNSKYVCIYDVRTHLLLRKFTISQNLSLDGTQEFLNSRNMTDAGPLDLILDNDDLSDPEDRFDRSLPGAAKGDLSLRRTRPEARTKSVRFSPTGRAWAAASTEGLLIYSLDDALLFDPFDLEIDITPDSVLATLYSQEYLKALCMAFRLNEKPLIQKVYEAVPPEDVEIVSRDLPQKYLERLLKFLAGYMEQSPHVEFHLLWVTRLLMAHGRYLREHRGEFQSVFRGLQRGVGKVQEDIGRLVTSPLIPHRKKPHRCPNFSQTRGNVNAPRMTPYLQEQSLLLTSTAVTTSSNSSSPTSPTYADHLRRPPTPQNSQTYTLDQVQDWTEDQVVEWLHDVGFGGHEHAFADNGINGGLLLEIDHQTLKELEIPTVGERVKILSAVKQLRRDCLGSPTSRYTKDRPTLVLPPWDVRPNQTTVSPSSSSSLLPHLANHNLFLSGLSSHHGQAPPSYHQSQLQPETTRSDPNDKYSIALKGSTTLPANAVQRSNSFTRILGRTESKRITIKNGKIDEKDKEKAGDLYTPTSPSTIGYQRSSIAHHFVGYLFSKRNSLEGPTITGGIMSVDKVKQQCVRVFGEDGQHRIVEVLSTPDVRTIMTKVLHKFGIETENVGKYSIFVGSSDTGAGKFYQIRFAAV